MERFAFKIDKTIKANLYKICRLCGIDNPEKVNILGDCHTTENVNDGEPELWRKVQACIGFTILQDDKMPQTMCTLCVDKVNDFFEFREMCFATNSQTRKLLGLKEEQKPQLLPVAINTFNDFDTKQVLPSTLGRRKEIFSKGKRKRKSEDVAAKSPIAANLEEIKEEKATFTPVGTPLRKKSKLLYITNIASNKVLTSVSDLQKKSKALTSSQRKTFDQVEKYLKPKEEIKNELTERSIEGGMVPSNTIASTVTKATTGKLKNTCNICDQRFINKSQLERHQYITHIPNVPKYVCTACNETIKKYNEIKNHQLWHKLSKTPFVCGLCGAKLHTTYAYSRHLHLHTTNVAVEMLILDRQCPQCQKSFATNYLYNTHPCSLATKICAGCNCYQKDENEYMMHAPYCPKIYLTYSKHISSSSIAEDSCIQIKNENEVEAEQAAGVAFGQNPDTSLNMSHNLAFTRLAAPMLMQSNQCVLIPGLQLFPSNDTSPFPTTSNVKLKKPNKKSDSRKEMKRVGELLKSTMDTLVSIKHEPEIHMDTSEAMPQATTAVGAVAINENVSSLPLDDFHDDSSEDNNNFDPSMLASVIIKEERIDDSENCGLNSFNLDTSRIKQEAGAVDPSKIPVLKLKITKEHGMLNSSLVEEEDLLRSDKKRKKKKRKEGVFKEMLNDEQNSSVYQDASMLMPQPGIIHIKQERLDNEEAAIIERNQYRKEGHFNTDDDDGGRLLMTTIPNNLDLKISCVSSGVEFSDDTFTHSATKDDSESFGCNQVQQQEDVKPCREDLDRLLQITHVSGGVEISQGGIFDSHQATEVPVQGVISEKSPTVESLLLSNNVESPTSICSTEAPLISLPKIVAISSGKDVAETFPVSYPEQDVVVKTERFDIGYGDDSPQANDNQISASNSAELNDNSRFNNTRYLASSDQQTEEQEYISKINFNNITIKKEKDIEVSEVELSESFAYADMMSNGLNSSKQEITQQKGKQPLSRADDADGTQDLGTFSEDDDDDGEEEEDEELEVREYREMEMPPLLTDDVTVGEAGSLENFVEGDNKVDKQLITKPFSAANIINETESLLNSGVDDDDVNDSAYDQNAKTVVHKRASPTTPDVSNTECINGSITQTADVELNAVPFHSPTGATTSFNELAEINPNAASVEINTNQIVEFNSSEETENQLNHEISVEQQVVPLFCLEGNNDETSSAASSSSFPPDSLRFRYLDSPASSFDINNRLSEEPSNSASNLAEALPKLNEETENLIHENNAAFGRLQQNNLLVQAPSILLADCHNDSNAFRNDNSNINEIAENNNNANIERELQADSSSLSAITIEAGRVEDLEVNDQAQEEAEQQLHGIT